MPHRFWLGSHVMAHIDRTSVPLFVSFRQLRGRRKPFKQTGPVAIDSGGFSELSLFGEWTISPIEYVRELRRLRDEVGLNFEWAAGQDWMCEPHMIEKTGLSVAIHQARTIDNFMTLRFLAPELAFVPVLQGQTLADYLDHAAQFERAGFDLRAQPLVGVGSVCRRQASAEIEGIMRGLSSMGLKLHGFGVKKQGLARYSDCLESSDSLAWSMAARRSQSRCLECEQENRPVKNCANCLKYALAWRADLLRCLNGRGNQ